MFSNKYIYIYTTIMVVIVAVLLALAATLLQPYQEANKKIEKMQNILEAAGVKTSSEDAMDLYKKYIFQEITVDTKGNQLSDYNSETETLSGKGMRAFDIDMKVVLEEGNEAELPVFVCKENDNLLYIIPLRGKGLWGPVWGYVSLYPDMNTIKGATFAHKGETPGLGAEIATAMFQNTFEGKTIFKEDGEFVSVTVQKGGVSQFKGDPTHAVDAISGGTITSAGVSDMLYECLGLYVPYFKKKQYEQVLEQEKTQDTVLVATEVVSEKGL